MRGGLALCVTSATSQPKPCQISSEGESNVLQPCPRQQNYCSVVATCSVTLASDVSDNGKRMAILAYSDTPGEASRPRARTRYSSSFWPFLAAADTACMRPRPDSFTALTFASLSFWSVSE